MKKEIVALILVLLVVAGVPAAMLLYDQRQRPADEITLIGRTPLRGNWSQREIRVKQGAVVRLRLTSEDVTHGFLIPDLGVNGAPISPGVFKTVEFTAERAGVFNFYCNNLCSHEHGGMTGKIIVE